MNDLIWAEGIPDLLLCDARVLSARDSLGNLYVVIDTNEKEPKFYSAVKLKDSGYMSNFGVSGSLEKAKEVCEKFANRSADGNS